MPEDNQDNRVLEGTGVLGYHRIRVPHVVQIKVSTVSVVEIRNLTLPKLDNPLCSGLPSALSTFEQSALEKETQFTQLFHFRIRRLRLNALFWGPRKMKIAVDF